MGYNNVYKMFEEFRTKKLLTSEVAEKLKISHMRTSQLLRVFNEKRSQRYWPGKGKGKRRNKDGFVNRYAYQRWLKVAHKLGHSTVTEAILTFKRLGYTKRAVAKEFGVNEVTFRNHLKRAKIKW